jgi:hypothetical protein
MFKRAKKSTEPKKQRFKEIRDAYQVTKQVKPLIGLQMALIFLAAWALGIVIGILIGHPIYLAFVTMPVAALLAFFIFTRQAGSAAYASIEGQMGAGASVLMAIRKGWSTTPAVAVSRNQDMVHRSVGRAGIVLTAEGSNSVRQLLQDEKRKTERYAPGVPIYELIIGESEGQVNLRKLQKQMKKYPKKLSANQMREVRARLKAVTTNSAPIPKGPMPTKGMKVR